MKSYIQIDGKYLGTLLYFKDAAGRGCIKLSFGNKIGGFVKMTDVPSTMPVPLKLTDPMSLDISYKFADSLLEVKKIINGKIEREFYKIPLPISNYLFIVRIKDWKTLDDAELSDNPLVLTPPSATNPSVAVTFSFLGENSLPFQAPQYQCPMGMRPTDLPESPLNKFCIGIGEDANPDPVNGFNLMVSYPISKNEDLHLL